jgi:hypothetical protein
MPVAPLQQHEQGGSEFASLGGEDVLGPAASLRVGNALEDVLVAKQLEPVGEHVGGDPEALLELLEALRAHNGVAQDEQRPALPDDL